MPHPSHSSRFYHPHNTEWGVQIFTFLIMFSPLPCYLVPLWPKYSPNTLFSKTSAYVPPSISATKFHTHTKQQAKVYVSKYRKHKINISIDKST
jgi:hypothetical protein